MEVSKTLTLVALMSASMLAVANVSPSGAKAHVDLSDRAALQRGAKMFVNYCLSCHSAAYMRYSRLAPDLGIPEDAVKQNLMFATDKIGNTMEVAMRPADAEVWFGIKPPDLSVVARSRGPDWIYGYLTSYYLDPKKPAGVNNLVYKDTAMPHVLWELQGWQTLVTGPDGKAPPSLELTTPGKLNAEEYRHAVNDLVSYLVYMSEPVQLERKRVGIWVLAFIGLLGIILYLVKKEYWKDIH